MKQISPWRDQKNIFLSLKQSASFKAKKAIDKATFCSYEITGRRPTIKTIYPEKSGSYNSSQALENDVKKGLDNSDFPAEE